MNRVMHFVVRWSMWLVSLPYFRVRRIGVHNLPRQGGVLLVANHLSHLDPPLLGAFAPRRLRFLARSTLGRHSAAKWLLEGVGAIFVRRGRPTRESMQAAIDVLRDGNALLVFPEGTRSREGMLQPFQRGFELVARRGHAVIVPVGIRGAGRAFPPGARFPKPTKIELHFGEPIDDLQAFGGAEALRAVVANLADQPLGSAKCSDQEAVLSPEKTK